jgi:hypothetical protein
VTIHVPDIGRRLPVYVADHYEGFDALPFPEINEMELSHYLDANIASIRSVPSPDIALANHLAMGPVILARGLEGRAPYAVKIHGSALEYTVRPHRERFLPYALEGIRGALPATAFSTSSIRRAMALRCSRPFASLGLRRWFQKS